jgi:hypothetical protein
VLLCAAKIVCFKQIYNLEVKVLRNFIFTKDKNNLALIGVKIFFNPMSIGLKKLKRKAGITFTENAQAFRSKK